MPYQPTPASAPAPAPGVLLARGVCRGLTALGHAPITEFTLPSGLRMDVLALAGDGTLVCVEVKSSRADFVSDTKWSGYRAWCDLFYFAVPEGFPDEILPSDAGLMRADAYGAEVLRAAPEVRLPAARRKALTLRFARLASDRLAAATFLRIDAASG